MDRLQKILSQAGIASRRAAEKLIAEGRVTVNGATVRAMGTKADAAQDDIRVDGRRVKGAERHRYILLNKPAGVVTTRSDPQRRPTVIQLLGGVREYVYPVGRLDYDTEGLLLLTNDGDLAAKLTHPSHGVERTYEAHVAGVPDEDAIERLRRGIPLDGRRTLPAQVTRLGKGPARAADHGPARAGHYVREGRREGRQEREGVVVITIREGRNRQVRRMLEAVGHPVRALRRTRIGPVADRQLRPGEWRELSAKELAALRRAAEFDAPRPTAAAAAAPRAAPPASRRRSSPRGRGPAPR
jgi:23S rRNA pseudouridine2605 synthase